MPKGIYIRTEKWRKSLNVPHKKGSGIYERTKATKRKIGEAHKGEKCNFWKGGISSIKRLFGDLIRRTFEYRQWRSDIFTRDNFTCQGCGDKKGGNLEAHHKKSFAKILEENDIKTLEEALNCEELWNINKGITYCNHCHKLTDNYGGERI